MYLKYTDFFVITLDIGLLRLIRLFAERNMKYYYFEYVTIINLRP